MPTTRASLCTTDTPGARPVSIANSEVSSDVISRPPCWTNARRCSKPSSPRPGRVSAVESSRPRFGVRSVFCHGVALPYLGVPLRIDCVEAVPHRRKDDHVVLAAEICFCGRRLGADVRVRNARMVELIAPPAFGLCSLPGVHERDPRRLGRMRGHIGCRCHAGRIKR